MYRENAKWAQTQEKEFRMFAADETAKRLRFKPMSPHQRVFIHAISEDFGLDSESMDPEPHRHVAVFKTPRFVMAPMKTLADCVRIRMSTPVINTYVSTTENVKQFKSSNEPYNGFLISSPRFSLTIEELHRDLSSALETTPGLSYDVSFLPSEEVVVKAHPAATNTPTVLTPEAIETALRHLKTSITSLVTSNQLGQAVRLCTLDPSLNILRREVSSGNGKDEAAADGWSQVAAKAVSTGGRWTVPPKQAVGGKTAFTVLGSKVKEKKQKQQNNNNNNQQPALAASEEDDEVGVVDDWEEFMDDEEAAAGRQKEEIRREREREREESEAMHEDKHEGEDGQVAGESEGVGVIDRTT